MLNQHSSHSNVGNQRTKQTRTAGDQVDYNAAWRKIAGTVANLTFH